MRIHKYIFLISIFTIETVIADDFDFTVSIEGKSEIPSNLDDSYTVIVKRIPDKKIVDSSELVYKWVAESSDDGMNFKVNPVNRETTSLSLEDGEDIVSAVCCKISCEVTRGSISHPGSMSVRFIVVR